MVSIKESDKAQAISYSLYGERSIYAVGVVENVILARKYFPGWKVVVHAEQGHYAIDRLKREGAVLVLHPKSPEHTGMLWRFETCDYPEFSHVIVRDGDDRLSARDAKAVAEWIVSGKPFHRIRDHLAHEKWPIMGGMWGVRVGRWSIANQLAKWHAKGEFKDDQRFLQQLVWPLVESGCFTHSGLTGGGWFAPSPKRNFIGSKIEPVLPDTAKVVVLSAKHYQARRKRFNESYSKHAGSLRSFPLNVFEGTPREQVFSPPTFHRMRHRAHWWAATCDHIRIMEQALAEGCEYLLMLEDDARFVPDFNEMFWRMWCCLPDDWRAVRLSRNRGVSPKVIVPGILERAPAIGGQMLANLWSRAGMMRFYDHSWYRRRMTIDGMFADLRRLDPVGWYQTVRPIIQKDPLAKQKGRE
jgi:hypothetical protein